MINRSPSIFSDSGSWSPLPAELSPGKVGPTAYSLTLTTINSPETRILERKVPLFPMSQHGSITTNKRVSVLFIGPIRQIESENLIATLLDTYVYSEAAEAKNILIGKCEELNISESIGDFTIKRVEGKRDALRRVVTDAVGIWVIDRELKAGAGKLKLF